MLWHSGLKGRRGVTQQARLGHWKVRASGSKNPITIDNLLMTISRNGSRRRIFVRTNTKVSHWCWLWESIKQYGNILNKIEDVLTDLIIYANYINWKNFALYLHCYYLSTCRKQPRLKRNLIRVFLCFLCSRYSRIGRPGSGYYYYARREFVLDVGHYSFHLVIIYKDQQHVHWRWNQADPIGIHLYYRIPTDIVWFSVIKACIIECFPAINTNEFKLKSFFFEQLIPLSLRF